jgi:hypothetical protein
MLQTKLNSHTVRNKYRLVLDELCQQTNYLMTQLDDIYCPTPNRPDLVVRITYTWSTTGRWWYIDERLLAHFDPIRCVN